MAVVAHAQGSSSVSGRVALGEGVCAVLSEVPLRQAYAVVDVVAPAGAPDWAGRLAEIGFLSGEQVQVLSRGVPGGEPLAVRVGTSTFALRRAEAACVRVVARD